MVKLLAERSKFTTSMCSDKYGSTPLHTAAMRGNAVAVQTLLDYCDTLTDPRGNKLMDIKVTVNVSCT